jgi:hypothetical protein
VAPSSFTAILVVAYQPHTQTLTASQTWLSFEPPEYVDPMGSNNVDMV